MAPSACIADNEGIKIEKITNFFVGEKKIIYIMTLTRKVFLKMSLF